MKELDFHQKDLITRLFLSSIYKNHHPGWTTLDDLLESPSGHVYLFDDTENPILIGIQQVSARIVWLHSFYSLHNPKDCSLAESIKVLPALSGKNIYAISSHRWFSDILEKNHFTNPDSIIQMEKSGPLLPALKPLRITQNTIEFRKLTENDVPDILQTCETAFAPLWRLTPEELDKAYADASLAFSIRIEGQLAGYLLAAADTNGCHILRLAVAAEYQEQGLASALLSRLFHENCDNPGFTASVNTNMRNFQAVQLYKKFGFKLENINLPLYCKYIPPLKNS